MNDAQKLAAIRDLCDTWDGPNAPFALGRIRAVLDAPSSPTPTSIDRDALRQVLRGWFGEWDDADECGNETILDRILALVGPGRRIVPALPTSPDRSALKRELRSWLDAGETFDDGADRILALVGSGVRLDRDKARAHLLWTYGGREVEVIEQTLDALEGCIVPGPGVTLTPEQASLHREALSTAAWVNHHLKPEREAEFTAEWERLGREARP